MRQAKAVAAPVVVSAPPSEIVDISSGSSPAMAVTTSDPDDVAEPNITVVDALNVEPPTPAEIAAAALAETQQQLDAARQQLDAAQQLLDEALQASANWQLQAEQYQQQVEQYQQQAATANTKLAVLAASAIWEVSGSSDRYWVAAPTLGEAIRLIEAKRVIVTSAKASGVKLVF